MGWEIQGGNRDEGMAVEGQQEAKVGSQVLPGITGKFGLGVQNKTGQKLTVLSREYCGHTKQPFPTTPEMI